MIYKNKKTGNIIDISCELRGEDWEELKIPSKTPSKKKVVKKDDETVCNN